jgi:hypothetical protein
MGKEPQITVTMSEFTLDLMEKYIRQTGVTRAYIVEQALLHHLQALDELPVEYVVHPRVVVSRKTGEDMLQDAESPQPAPALRDLVNRGD